MNDRIEDSVRKLYEALKRKKEVDEYVEAVKKKEYLVISNYMFANMKKGVECFDIRLDDGETYYMNPISLKVTRIRKKKMVWDLERLRTFLGRSRYESVVNKRYEIINMPGLVKYLKSCGVDPKKFKTFLSVEQNVDETKMDAMLETGEIKQEEIRNCYTVEVGQPYFRLTEKK